MRKLILSFVSLILLALLAACNQNGGLSKEHYKQIKEGMTQAEVEQLAGSPSKKEENNPYDVWIYKGKDGIKKDSTVRIEFSEEKNVLFKSQKNLFEPPKAEEEKYTAEGELLEFISMFNSFVDNNKELDFLQPISTEDLDKKTVTFFDGQGTKITITDPKMIDDTNHYTNKVSFEIASDGEIKTIYFIGSDVEYPVLILASLNISEDTINKVVESYEDRDLENLKSKSFDFNADPYQISITNGTPKTMDVTVKE